MGCLIENLEEHYKVIGDDKILEELLMIAEEFKEKERVLSKIFDSKEIAGKIINEYKSFSQKKQSYEDFKNKAAIFIEDFLDR